MIVLPDSVALTLKAIVRRFLSALRFVFESVNVTVTLRVAGDLNVFAASFMARFVEPIAIFAMLARLIVPLRSGGAMNL